MIERIVIPDELPTVWKMQKWAKTIPKGDKWEVFVTSGDGRKEKTEHYKVKVKAKYTNHIVTEEITKNKYKRTFDLLLVDMYFSSNSKRVII